MEALPNIYNKEVDDTFYGTLGKALEYCSMKLIDDFTMAKDDLRIPTAREDVLFRNFGIVYGFIQELPEQTTEEYRRVLQAIYSATITGSTKESIAQAVAVLSGVDEVTIYELYKQEDIDALISKHGEKILEPYEGMDLRFYFAVEVPWSSFSFSQGSNRIQRFLNAIKPSHTQFILIYPVDSEFEDAIEVSEELTKEAGPPENRVGHAKVGYSEAG